jgi:hypothetical protein
MYYRQFLKKKKLLENKNQTKNKVKKNNPLLFLTKERLLLHYQPSISQSTIIRHRKIGLLL